MTVIADSGSSRALILNADEDLTGVVGCATTESPIDAIIDTCVSDGVVYLAGVQFEADSDVIKRERVVAYDKGGTLRGVVFELSGGGYVTPSIKAICDALGGVAFAYDKQADQASDNADLAAQSTTIKFVLVDKDGVNDLSEADVGDAAVHDAALCLDGDIRYATLSFRGVVDDGVTDTPPQEYDGHVFTDIDVGANGALYACDDATGAAYVMRESSDAADLFADGEDFQNVHANSSTVSLCASKSNKVVLCGTTGTVTSAFSTVKPSAGFSVRMVVVWASGLYLAVLAIVLVVREVRRRLASRDTHWIGPVLLVAAVVSAIAIAVGNLSFSSYESSLETRAREINMCADYLQSNASDLSGPMERITSRNELRKFGKVGEVTLNPFEVAEPAMILVNAANTNAIGMYCTVYGRDDQGAFYLYGSSFEHVMGTSARASGSAGVEAAFELDYPDDGKMQRGRTLRDVAQYRFVQIPASDGKSVVGVVEIGSKMRSFESSVVGNLTQQVIALIVMVLVVYLAYRELRECGHCLFAFQARRSRDPERSVAVLTRPFTLAITMLTSIDSVMTVLIARDLLTRSGAGESGTLLALPAVMLGIGLVIGQILYGKAGSRVGLRRLMAGGAVAMFACACFTCAAVLSGNFWLYCAAKLAMAAPFGMLYALGYSLPRLATDDETRALAAGGVKRTDTSAAALGTVLGGYAAQIIGNASVYVLVAVASIPVIIMALNLLPRGMKPLEQLAQPDRRSGRALDFVRTPAALSIALLILLPSTVAAGYASFLFPLFSNDLGLQKSDINNIVVMGQLLVYVCISGVDRVEARYGKRRVSTVAIALLGLVFLLFAVRTTLAWSLVVIPLVALLCKSSDGWKALWLEAAGKAGVAAGRAMGAMFATRSIILIAQPFILGALLGVADSVAIIVIGALCAACSLAFYLATRRAGTQGFQGRW
ncbi:MAG: MFS transporter [Eggerthellaceae bacterium]|nr:MFS transporter [Eggerthellaceae bacterium]